MDKVNNLLVLQETKKGLMILS